MNRRAVALSVSAVAALSLLTACGSAAPVNPSAHGMVVEQEKQLNRSGDTEYKLTLTTDRKSIRRHVSRDVKEKEIYVSETVWNNCSLKEMYPGCK